MENNMPWKLNKKIFSENVVDNNGFYYNMLILSTMFLLAYVAKAFQYVFLPSSYFGDSYYLLGLVDDHNLKFGLYEGGFNNIAVFFRYINLLGLNTLFDWSVCIAVVFNIIIIGYVVKNKIKSLFELIMAYLFLGLMNIYVFNLSKEIIQFIIFTLLYFCAKSNCRNFLKVILICSLFFLESIFFRQYYILTMAFFPVLYVLMPKILQKKRGFKDIVKLIIIALGGLYIFLSVCEVVLPLQYQRLVNVRGSLVAAYHHANTLIENLIPVSDAGNNKILYIANYIINFIRAFFPVELITKGIFYWPFCFFQFLCTYKLLKNIVHYKSLTEKEKIYLNIMLAYYITSCFFEPDFGTFTRHEAATAPVLFNLMITDLQVGKKGNALMENGGR